MSEWNYDPARYDPNATIDPVPEGRHIMKIYYAETLTSKSGKRMIHVSMHAKGHASEVHHYFVNGPKFQYIIDKFFDSFAIDPNTALNNIAGWQDCIGGAEIEHEEYNGHINAKVKRWISRDEMAATPPPENTEPVAKSAREAFVPF